MRFRAALLTIYTAFTIQGVRGSYAMAAPSADVSGDKSSSKFSVSEQTQVPGTILRPGAYTIHILDHLSDRLIVQIDGAPGNTHTTFLGVNGAKAAKPSSSGVMAYGSGATAKGALRGFSFSNGTVVDFVYPKADAVALAKANGEKVPAIDPESEGRVAASDLSRNDMQMVTLWMLSTTDVGTDGGPAGVKAERLQQVASARPRPVLTRLPHTASYLPLSGLAAVFCLCGAAILRARRIGA